MMSFVEEVLAVATTDLAERMKSDLKKTFLAVGDKSLEVAT